MKQIKVVTYCTWTSFGSLMQALGLKRALEGLGYKSTILLQDGSNDIHRTRIRSVKSFLQRTVQILIAKKRTDARGKGLAFLSDNLDITYFSSYESLEKMMEEDPAQIVLAGSDQIWNPDLCDPVFFLQFAKGKKRISYAASMGKTQVTDDKRDCFTQLVNTFDQISVREQEAAQIIQELTGRRPTVHIDPTFLVSAEQWRSYEREYPVAEPYILLYMLYWNNACKEKIKKLKRETGLPVYAIAGGLSRAYADRYLFDVGPGEFLWLIDHARYVVTSSFHGTAFSVMFNKQFAAVVNPASPSRIENLLRTLQVPQVRIEELAQVDEFDYPMINLTIQAEKERSMDYLKKVLE